MIRYWVAALVAAIAAVLLLGVVHNPALRRDDAAVPTDELLAYDLAATHGVTMDLLEQTRELRLTSWAVVQASSPEERFDYALRIQWQTARGQSLGESLLAFESRVSEAATGLEARSFAARLAYSNTPVTDPRTVSVVVPEFSGQRPARIQVSVGAAGQSRILLRATFPEPRHALQIAALDQRLTDFERQELVRDRASVDYDDLPFSLRRVALSAWQRRLDAHGQVGRDYRVERLLIGAARTSAGLAAAAQRNLVVHRRHALALNLRRPVELQLTAAARSVLQIAPLGALQPRSVTLDEAGRATIQLGEIDAPQTVVIGADTELPIPVRISVPNEGVEAVIGGTRHDDDPRYQTVQPLNRRIEYYQLDPEDPVRVNVASGQRFLGLNVRGTHEQLSGHVSAEIAGEQAGIDVDLAASLFEQWADEVPASDAQQLYLRLAPGARQVVIRGSPQLRIAPFTADPDVMAERLAPEYDVALGPGTRWMFARYDIDRTVALRPDNELELVDKQRKIELMAQSRIVSHGAPSNRPEVLLVPATPTVQRHVIEPLRWGPGIPTPEDAVVALDNPRRGYVASGGPRAGRVRLLYRIDAKNVGESIELEVDHHVGHREPTVTDSGQFELSVAPGVHVFGLGNRSNNAQILLEATPVEAAGALRRKVVHRIQPHALLRFVFDKATEPENVIVNAYVQRGRLVTLRYALYAAEQRDFLHSVTQTRGELAGVALEARGAWYWELGPDRHLNQLRQSITLGNDLKPGKVALVLRNQGPVEVFVSLVLVGQDVSNRRSLQRFWTTEEP